MNKAHEVVSSDLAHLRERLDAELATLAGRRVLITGGAGFLGYYLVQTLADWNREADATRRISIDVYDNLVRGAPGWLLGLVRAGQVRLIEHDITHGMPADAPAYGAIVHAASIASPTFYRQHPIATMDANVNGLRVLLEYSVERKRVGEPVEAFLFFSSSEIYGDPLPQFIPTPETYPGHVSCTGPRACYDESKRYGETLCVNFARQHDLPVKMARPFNNYGPGLKISDRRVLPDFARDVLSGRDIVLHSDGSPTRTFCYVADAVAGYFKVLSKGRPGEAYNIGTDAPEISMADLAETVVRLSGELFGYRGRVIRRASEDSEYLTDNPNRRCPVIDKARRELGYEPQFGLEEGLRRTLVWYQDNREGGAES